MANLTRIYANFQSGTVTDDPLADDGTTLNSAELATLPAVGSDEHMMLVLDPEGDGNGPEIVKVTAHTASDTSATIVRGQDGTSGVQHASGTLWLHGPVASDYTTVSTYTPTWKIATGVGSGTAPDIGSDGTLAGWYVRLTDKSYHVHVDMTFGSLYNLGSSNTWGWTLPTGLVQSSTFEATGTGLCVDSTVAFGFGHYPLRPVIHVGDNEIRCVCNYTNSAPSTTLGERAVNQTSPASSYASGSKWTMDIVVLVD